MNVNSVTHTHTLKELPLVPAQRSMYVKKKKRRKKDMKTLRENDRVT